MQGENAAEITRLWHALFDDPLLWEYGQRVDALVQPLLTRGATIRSLPRFVCSALGKENEAAETIIAVWQCIYRAAKLFDDIQDGDSRTPLAQAINEGLGVLWVAHHLLETDAPDLSADIRLAVLHRLHTTLLRATAGQDADIRLGQNADRMATPDEWETIARAKSGELLAWATWAMAWVLTQNSELSDAFATFGRHVGILLQVVDDFEGIWGAEGDDLDGLALNLAICYAYTVANDATRCALTENLARLRAGDLTDRAAVQQQLAAVGAREYLWAVGQTYAQLADTALHPFAPHLVTLAETRTLLQSLFPPFTATADP